MFKWCPWADALFALDIPWWERYRDWAEDAFAGRCYTAAPNTLGVEQSPALNYANSGTAAVALAAHFGAERVVAVGIDCQHGSNGERHCHGDHPAGLGNAGSVNEWAGKFARCAADHKRIEIINASRSTALNCWPQQSLEQALANAQQDAA